MMAAQNEILCEIISPRSKAGLKEQVISNFKAVFEISNQAAISSDYPPPSGLGVFNNSKAHPDEAGLFLFWESVEHHDGLSAAPGFAPAATIVGEKIIPALETPLAPFYVWTRQSEVALREAASAEVILIDYSGHETADTIGKEIDAVFDVIRKPEGFVGYFYGPKSGESTKFVVVTKWDSTAVIDDSGWTEESEKQLLTVFGGPSSITSRLQLFS